LSIFRNTNDGGAVNDPKLREFTLGAVRHNKHRKTNCDSKYSKEANEDKSFTLTVINPAFGGSLNGLQVLQQVTSFRMSKVQVGSWKISGYIDDFHGVDIQEISTVYMFLYFRVCSNLVKLYYKLQM
jgi:hypothetical protein